MGGEPGIGRRRRPASEDPLVGWRANPKPANRCYVTRTRERNRTQPRMTPRSAHQKTLAVVAVVDDAFAVGSFRQLIKTLTRQTSIQMDTTTNCSAKTDMLPLLTRWCSM